MKPNEIKVERLEIRLKGADARSAAELGASIGPEVLAQIAQQTNVGGRNRSIRIAHLDAGILQPGSGLRTPGTGTAIARQIGAIVKAKISSGTKGPR